MIVINKEKREEINRLVGELKSGGSEAFDDLYCEYSEKVFSYTKKILKNNEDAEDAVMDTFLSVSQNIGSLKKDENFESWLFKIAKNASLKIIKHNSEVETVSLETQEMFDYAAEKYSEETILVPEDYSSNEENKRVLADIINSLSAVQRQAIYLYYYKNIPVKQIAEQTGVSENTVKTRMLLAKKYIKSKVEKMREQGAMLSAVPIPLLFEELDDLVVIDSPVAATVSAGGLTAGITAITVASTAVIIGVSIMSGNYREKINVDNIQGDVRIVESEADSFSDSLSEISSSMTDSKSITDSKSMTDSSSFADTSESFITEENTEYAAEFENIGYQIEIPDDDVSWNYDIDDQNTETQNGPDDADWEKYLLTDIDGNPTDTAYWYTDKNDGSYIQVNAFKYRSDKMHIRYVMHNGTLDTEYYHPYLIGVESQKRYDPVRIYSDNNETVAEFYCSEWSLTVLQTQEKLHMQMRTAYTIVSLMRISLDLIRFVFLFLTTEHLQLTKI